MRYYLRVWCRDCFGVDYQGCFNGGDEIREYATQEDRDADIRAIEKDGVPWEVEMLTGTEDPT